MLRRFLPDSFVITLILTVILATIIPARGLYVQWVDWAATLAVIALFFFHGAKLKRKDIIAGFVHWRLHLTVLACTFILFPIIVFALHFALPNLLSKPLWTGLLFLSLLPSTVQSSIIFTSMARGNVPSAIASASASQLLGILITPIMVALLLGGSGARISASSIISIFTIIFVPFIIGHLLRPWIREWVERHKSTIRLSDRAAILLAVFSAFSAATMAGIWSQISFQTFGILIALCLIIFLLIFSATFLLSKALGFKVEDQIVVLFCGSKKSLVQGIPMARVIFTGPELGLVLLPVMLFHQLQLMICAWIARAYERKNSPSQKQDS